MYEISKLIQQVLKELTNKEIIKDNNKLEAQSYYEMGVCYLLSNEMTKAITSFQKSIMKDRDNLDVQLQLALAHELVHEEDMALKIYDKLIETELLGVANAR